MEDMDAPVTRRELRDELRQFKSELKTELKTELSELKSELKSELTASITKSVVLAVGEEMARQIRAGQEETRAWLRTLDDQYRDLPKRVTTIEASELPSRVAKLEAAVFSPPRKRRRKAS